MAAVATAALTGCGSKESKVETTEFVDDVKVALADSGRIECSQDGVNFSQMRICHMYAAAEEIQFGIYACSPEESSFTAVFSDMKITECAWKAHDGQQPDE